jgi:hypothetical protein
MQRWLASKFIQKNLRCFQRLFGEYPQQEGCLLLRIKCAWYDDVISGFSCESHRYLSQWGITSRVSL